MSDILNIFSDLASILVILDRLAWVVAFLWLAQTACKVVLAYGPAASLNPTLAEVYGYMAKFCLITNSVLTNVQAVTNTIPTPIVAPTSASDTSVDTSVGTSVVTQSPISGVVEAIVTVIENDIKKL